MIADEILRPAGKIGELCRGDINSQPLIERREHVSKMNRSRLWLFAPARGRADDLPAAETAAG